MAFEPEPSKIKAAMSSLLASIASVVDEQGLSGESVQAKMVGATIALTAISHYVRKLGIPKQVALSILSMGYDAGELVSPSVAEPDEEKSEVS